jgi:Lrp/AsnC family leucine-responsive transcriptional regulator/Lrp/AsnC family transcriptional regulator
MPDKIRAEQTEASRGKNLTQADLNLLAELEENARQPLSKLAEHLSISQQLLNYRLQALRRRQILGGYYTQINFPKLGYTKYRTLVRINNYTQQKAKEIVDYLRAHRNVQWIIECGGKWDLLINFIAKNVVQYDNFLRDIRNVFPQHIQTYEVFIVIEWIELGRAYFTRQKREVKTLSYFGRDYEPVKVDQTELRILDLIAENARHTSVEIAERIGVSPNTVSSRIKNLCSRGIIRAFKPLIHLENTGFMAYKLPFKFHNYTDRIEEELIEYLKTDVRVVAIVKMIGQWDFEIEFEVNSQESMLDLVRGFRDKYGGIIKEFELIPLFHEHMYNFFPRDLIA